MKEEREDDLENDVKQLKVRYSIETYEKLLVNQEEMHKRLMKLEEDRVNQDSRDKVA